MCIICASVPVAAAAGAKLNADQLKRPVDERKPIGRITGGVITLLVLVSIIYHALRWQDQ